MTERVQIGNLQVSKALLAFLNEDVLPETGVSSQQFWRGLEGIITDLGPKNKELILKRDKLQAQIDAWHEARKGEPHNIVDYKEFLKKIGYILPEGDPFVIGTSNLDDEISAVAGPQLVVPVSNARYALNAANARWGSLYDALYGTDVISDELRAAGSGGYNPERGQKVIDYAMQFLDETFPLKEGSHQEVVEYRLGKLNGNLELTACFGSKIETVLKNPSQFVGYVGESADSFTALVLKNNGLHVEIQIDPDHVVGRQHPAGIKDVLVESALTAIQDFEDSVAAVDDRDKVACYRNWLGLMNGDLEERFEKNGATVKRKLSSDRKYTSTAGIEKVLHGRSLLLVRNVGHLMTTDAVLDKNSEEIPETFLDAFVTTLCAMHDLLGNSSVKNSRTGSIYIVKPKMHGPEEVEFSIELFDRVEQALGLAPNTLKVGIMDEERRTTVNLKECIRAARDRVFFINTGFLDRTGDEIHTSMCAGAFLPKNELKNKPWIKAYEKWNVSIGLECGFKGRAQIGKGMWAMPDEMKKMIQEKSQHVLAGASCAWVPSPTAATLHSLHYHKHRTAEIQQGLEALNRPLIDDILSIPLMENMSLSETDIEKELENNAQGILGYVVRWIIQGIGCSKVPDINNVGLMEDRATLRISSQHIANWIKHGICTKEQVIQVLERMVTIVDEQNSDDAEYIGMSSDIKNSIAFQAACDLIFDGVNQPSGYTEPLLHQHRRNLKANLETATN